MVVVCFCRYKWLLRSWSSHAVADFSDTAPEGHKKQYVHRRLSLVSSTLDSSDGEILTPIEKTVLNIFRTEDFLTDDG